MQNHSVSLSEVRFEGVVYWHGLRGGEQVLYIQQGVNNDEVGVTYGHVRVWHSNGPRPPTAPVAQT